MPNDVRRYELPGIEDLTKEQEKVLALPREGHQLIVGGPGTGKTVVCLLRARRHAQSKENYRFLVWNHLLHQASLAVSEGKLQATTLNSWFWKVFREFVGKNVPTVETADGVHWKPTDWKAVEQLIANLPNVENKELILQRLVIDEGQDMPPGFYDALLQLGFKNIFVAADQNQQIGDENSSLEELKDYLGVEELKLTHNHRNSRRIACLARAFYSDPASPPPDLPPQGGTIYTPRLYYVSEATMPRVARSILRHWDQDPRRLIGVIAPCNEVRKNYLSAMRDSSERLSLDSGRPKVETHHSGYHPSVQFDRGGILVINAQACKGLEFDSVVLADIDQHIVNDDDLDRTKKLFYVMVSRARQRVVMFMKRGGGPDMKLSGSPKIEEVLPRDDRILRREDLAGEAVNRGETA